MKITRRQLALTAAGAMTAAPAVSLAAAQQSSPAAPADWDRVARESHLESSQAIAKVDVPMLLEPAFQFKA